MLDLEWRVQLFPRMESFESHPEVVPTYPKKFGHTMHPAVVVVAAGVVDVAVAAAAVVVVAMLVTFVVAVAAPMEAVVLALDLLGVFESPWL